jgi:hypothetical protein
MLLETQTGTISKSGTHGSNAAQVPGGFRLPEFVSSKYFPDRFTENIKEPAHQMVTGQRINWISQCVHLFSVLRFLLFQTESFRLKAEFQTISPIFGK